MSPVRLVAGACLPVSVVRRCFFLAGGCAVDDGLVLWVVSTEPGGWWELPGQLPFWGEEFLHWAGVIVFFLIHDWSSRW